MVYANRQIYPHYIYQTCRSGTIESSYWKNLPACKALVSQPLPSSLSHILIPSTSSTRFIFALRNGLGFHAHCELHSSARVSLLMLPLDQLALPILILERALLLLDSTMSLWGTFYLSWMFCINRYSTEFSSIFSFLRFAMAVPSQGLIPAHKMHF